MPWVDKKGGDGMLTWESVELPENLIKQLLAHDCLRVMDHRKSAAALTLRSLFAGAEHLQRFDMAEPKRQEARAQLANLAQKAADFSAELNALGDVARVWLGMHDYRRDDVRLDAAERRFRMNDLLEIEDGG